MTAPPGYFIEDPRPIAEEAPYTFFLPPSAWLSAIAQGDWVKAIFQYQISDVEKW